MRTIMSSVLLLTLLVVLCGCATVNKGADAAGKVTKEVGRTSAKILDIGGAISEGGAEAMMENDEANPYDR